MEFSAAWRWISDHRGYVYGFLFGLLAVFEFAQGEVVWPILHVVLGLFSVWVFQCPTGFFHETRRPVGVVLADVKVLSFEEGETLSERVDLRKGVEPVETPSDNPIAVHSKDCAICADWVASFDKKREGKG